MKEISDIEFIKIGKIIKTHSFKGELVVKLFIEFNQILKTELFFVNIDGITVPFFTSQNIRSFKKSQMLIMFEDIDSDIKATKLINSDIFLENINIEEVFEEESQSLENFKVYNNKVFLGSVESFLNIPSNPILSILTPDNEEILIPYNDNFIEKTDYKKEEIYLNLPQDLLNINK